jgi:thiosulfate dehydrogenase [quinone] large subunit
MLGRLRPPPKAPPQRWASSATGVCTKPFADEFRLCPVFQQPFPTIPPCRPPRHSPKRHQVETPELEPWRAQAFGILRIVFGLVWAVDATFKWLPDFQNGFVTYLTGALDGQPIWVTAWIGFWIDIVKVNPHLFAIVVAAGETALAFGLIFGVLSNLAALGGVLLTMVIWTTAEGFGGPYAAGSTDIGTAIISLFVLSQAGLKIGLDRYLTPTLGRWGWLASGNFHKHSGAR